MSTSEGCISAAKNSETVASLEALVCVWCQQIEGVLAQGSQIRKEADDSGMYIVLLFHYYMYTCIACNVIIHVYIFIGPLAELEYWRQRTSKFSYLVDQIKSQPCRGVITTLGAAKSRVLKVKCIT